MGVRRYRRGERVAGFPQAQWRGFRYLPAFERFLRPGLEPEPGHAFWRISKADGLAPPQLRGALEQWRGKRLRHDPGLHRGKRRVLAQPEYLDQDRQVRGDLGYDGGVVCER